MVPLVRFVLLVLLAWTTTACVTTRSTTGTAAQQQMAEQCVPDIRATGGWLAADGGRSIPLPNGTAIHLFGDTLLGPESPQDKRGETFVGNTVAVAECVGGDYRLRYYWRKDGRGRFAIFDLEDGKTRLWPMDGFFSNGKLHVMLTKILAVSHGLGFEYGGTVLATVHNPFDAPPSWKVSYVPVVQGMPPFRPDLGITVWGDYAYVFSSLKSASYPHPGVLLRVHLGGLSEPERHLQYLSRAGAWKYATQFSAPDAWVTVPAVSTTMYVHWHPGLRKWVTVHADPVFGSPNVHLRTADRLQGPWSPPVVVYQFPEMTDPRNKGRGVLCYAVAEHPQLRKQEGRILVVTYACNTLKGALPSKEDLEFYRPKTIFVDLARLPT